MNASQDLFQLAQRYIPGGVNSPVRAFRGVGGSPLFIKRAQGAYIFDTHDQAYIDYVGSWGPMIAGHAHPHVIEAVNRTIVNGLSFGAPTELEIRLAQRICELMPNIEKIRCVNSGTEAAMSAIRLARGFTGRNKIIKFAGCYHGHADSLLVAAGSGCLTLGVPSSAGVPQSLAEHTLVCQYNQIEEVKEVLAAWGEDVAAIIVEPVAGNMNCILPQPEFLPALRTLCDQYGAVLIFDEVITGFRVGLGGAQAHFNVKPDLTVLGKIIGGGMPVGAFGGLAKIMDQIAPLGPVYQAGTLSGNPLAMAAGLATLDLIAQPNFYTQLSKQLNLLLTGLTQAAHAQGIPFKAHGIGGLFGIFFTDQTILQNENDVMKCDLAFFKKFFHAMLAEGIYLAPSAFEAGFISSAHDNEIIQHTIEKAQAVFAKLVNDKH